MQTARPVTKPSKQRKMLFQTPDHRRLKHFAAPLTAELRASHGVKAIPVRRGDTVRIARGEHKGFEGKITRVDRMSYRVYVEGLTREKVDGSTIFVPVHPSKVVITRLNLDDKWRKKVLETKGKVVKKAEVVEEKPLEKVTEAKEEITEEKKVVEEKIKEKKPKRAKREAKKPAKEKVKVTKPRVKRKTASGKAKKTEKTEEGGA